MALSLLAVSRVRARLRWLAVPRAARLPVVRPGRAPLSRLPVRCWACRSRWRFVGCPGCSARSARVPVWPLWLVLALLFGSPFLSEALALLF